MRKPITVSWMRYYVLSPLQDMWGTVKDWFGEVHVRLIGGWYCEYCQKVHGRRVLKYKLFFTKDGAEVSKQGTLSEDYRYSDRLTCSLGHDALVEGTWKPERPERPTLDQALSQLLGSCDRLSSALKVSDQDDSDRRFYDSHGGATL